MIRSKADKPAKAVADAVPDAPILAQTSFLEQEPGLMRETGLSARELSGYLASGSGS